MSDYFSGAADAGISIERVQQQIEAAQLQAERAQHLEAKITAIRETARSPRGHVAVTVDASGRLTGLDLSREALRWQPGALANVIVQAAHAAQRTAGARAIDLTAVAFGADSGVVERLRIELDERSSLAKAGR